MTTKLTSAHPLTVTTRDGHPHISMPTGSNSTWSARIVPDPHGNLEIGVSTGILTIDAAKAAVAAIQFMIAYAESNTEVHVP